VQKPVSVEAEKARAHRRRTAEPQDFRSVLAASVEAAGVTEEKATARRPERSLRVSVRLSCAEELLLQQSAARAGVTVSEYLRMRAFDRPQEEVQAKPDPFSTSEIQPVAPQTARSGLGDWIMLLRQRFSASPVRFAERA
jgi:hypothetical protein